MCLKSNSSCSPNTFMIQQKTNSPIYKGQKSLYCYIPYLIVLFKQSVFVFNPSFPMLKMAYCYHFTALKSQLLQLVDAGCICQNIAVSTLAKHPKGNSCFPVYPTSTLNILKRGDMPYLALLLANASAQYKIFKRYMVIYQTM